MSKSLYESIDSLSSLTFNEDYEVNKDSKKIEDALENLSEKIDSIALKYLNKDFGTALCKLVKIYYRDDASKIIDDEDYDNIREIIDCSYSEDPSCYDFFTTERGSTCYVYLPMMIDYKNQNTIYYDGPETYVNNEGGTGCVSINARWDDYNFRDGYSFVLGGNVKSLCSVFDVEMTETTWNAAYKLLLDKNEVVRKVENIFKEVSSYVIDTAREIGDRRREDIANKQREYGNAIKSLESEDLTEAEGNVIVNTEHFKLVERTRSASGGNYKTYAIEYSELLSHISLHIKDYLDMRSDNATEDMLVPLEVEISYSCVIASDCSAEEALEYSKQIDEVSALLKEAAEFAMKVREANIKVEKID